MKFPEIIDLRSSRILPAEEAALLSQQCWALPEDHEDFWPITDCNDFESFRDNDEYAHLYRYVSKSGGWVYLHVDTSETESGEIYKIVLVDSDYGWSKFVTDHLFDMYGSCCDDSLAELCRYFDVNAEDVLDIASEDYSGPCRIWLDDAGHRSGWSVGDETGWLTVPETNHEIMIFDSYQAASHFIDTQAHPGAYSQRLICKA
jgi:hypothetical protein